MRAPELVDGSGEPFPTWFNTDAPLSLAGLRGRFVLLDFWTFCCGNCLHVIEELRPFEAEHADVLTVIGVHSPKFPHEADPTALRAALERYEVHHPVVNDPDLVLWKHYVARAWPTLVLIDPEGYVVAQAAGEGHVTAFDALLRTLRREHEERGTLRVGDTTYVPPAPQPSALRFPAKAIVLPAERTGRGTDSYLVADAGHHQLVELALDGETVLRRIGEAERGAPFAEPNGLALLPPGLVDYDVLVADTANHVLRGVRIGDGAVVTTLDLPALLADELTVTGSIPLALSPWDLVWWPAVGRVVVAAAGVHLLLSVDPVAGTAEVLAGTTVEGLRDGAALDAWLAQPSGVAVDGDLLRFVDAETSALRHLTVDKTVHTDVGEGLFDFGHVDGPAAQARLQHPLGLTMLPDGSVAVLDTYNGAVRRFDPSTGQVNTLATGLGEPSGAVLVGDRLVVVESVAHRLTATPLAAEIVDRGAQQVARPVTVLAAGTVSVDVLFAPPPGRKRDERYGPSTRVSITASPAELLLAGAGDSTDLRREVTLARGSGVLQITAQAASCDDLGTAQEDSAANPACYLSRQDWGVPVRVGPDGDTRLELTLLSG